MAIIKNIVVFGASGALGEPVLKELIKSGKFTITAITRKESEATFPSSVKVIKADLTSVSELTTALQGQDAIVSTVGFPGLQSQTVLVDAAVAAGVKRFIPSEFGSDTVNPKTHNLPVFGYKNAVADHIEKKAAAHPDFTYTYVVNGAFLDWGLNVGFLLPWQTGKLRVYDGGEGQFSATTLSSVGLAVVGILSNFEETKNRAVYVESIRISQNQLLNIAKKVAPEKTWETIPENTAEIKAAADEKVAGGDFSLGVLYEYLALAVYADGYGGLFAKTDNELLGVPTITEADVEAILKPILLK